MNEVDKQQVGSLPELTWADLEEALEQIAPNEDQRSLVPVLVGAVRKQAAFYNGPTLVQHLLQIADFIGNPGQEPRSRSSAQFSP